MFWWILSDIFVRVPSRNTLLRATSCSSTAAPDDDDDDDDGGDEDGIARKQEVINEWWLQSDSAIIHGPATTIAYQSAW